MLCKNIVMRCSHWAFQSKAYSTNHCYQQQQTCNNLQIRMYSVQSNTLICYTRTCCPVILPETITIGINSSIAISILSPAFLHPLRSVCQRHRKSLNRSLGKGLPQSQQCSKNQTKPLYTSYGVGSSLMSKNFSRWNIQKHYNKQKQNSQRSHVHLQLQKYKIFKPQQYQ